ncbi:MAG: hypothetical protein CR974_00090 [Gammaproteobacteria bacterium]|nr:MAG: hypothetical protein CR974_00090 [Gammaproteobacteria bacterium]
MKIITKKGGWLATVIMALIIAAQQGLSGGKSTEQSANSNSQNSRQHAQSNNAPNNASNKESHRMSNKTNQNRQNSRQTSNKSFNGPDSYPQALRILWTKVYRDHGNTLYCDKSFSTKSREARKRAQVNAEHVFPMSWVTKALQCGTRQQCQKNSHAFRVIEADLHNIYPARMDVNKARSNFRFGEVAGEERRFGSCDIEVDTRRRVTEPAPAKRGELARAMLYMAYQYDLPLDNKTRQQMQQWHREYPPSGEEKRREKIIRREQGRENPYITRYPFK